MNTSDCTKKVTLTLSRSEILDDINSYGYVEGDIMPDEVGNAKTETQDILQDGNRELCVRVVQLVLSRCREILYPFTKEGVDDTNSYTDNLTDASTYTVELMVPETFSKTTADFLCRLIHQLIVARVMQNWLSVTNPSASVQWMEKGDKLEQSLQSAKSIRIRKVRRGLSLF